MHLLESWRSEFGAGDLSRGEDYHSEGYVRSLSITSGGWNACVEGYYGDYLVFVPGDSKSMAGASCSCPRFENGYLCKHVVATCLDIESHQHDEAAQGRGGETRLQRLVRTADEDDVRKFLLEVLSVDDRLAALFAQRFGEVSVSEARSMLADQVARLVRECSDRGYINWDSAFRFQSEWHRIVGSSLDVLIERGAYDVALEVSFEALMSIQGLEMDDSNDVTGSAIDCVEGYWQSLLELGDQVFAHRMHDRIRRFLDSELRDDGYDVYDRVLDMAEGFLIDAFSDVP